MIGISFMEGCVRKVPIALLGLTLAAGPLLLAAGQAPAGPVTAPAGSLTAPSKDDEAQILAILSSSDLDEPSIHVAPDLDWENAFGIRYFDLAKRDRFYDKYVTPLQKSDTFTRLEVKIKLVDPQVAIADEYWREAGQLDQSKKKPGPDRWGRTTYVFSKKDGKWTEVLERVADLRLPYFKHYDAMPEPVKVAPEILASYGGSYESADRKTHAAIKLKGDRLEVATEGLEPSVGIATSATEFLMMNPDDVAEYYKGVFSKDADGALVLTLLSLTDKPFATLHKIP